MKLFILTIALMFSGSAFAQSSRIPSSVSVFLENPASLDGEDVILDGFLSLEDYSKALFTDVRRYEESDFSSSVPVIIPNYLLDRREIYERQNVRLTGRYEHQCAGENVFCSSHPGQGRVWVSSIDVLPEQPVEPGWRQRHVATAPHILEILPDDDPLLLVADEVFSQIGLRNRSGIIRHASGGDASVLSDDLYDSASRGTWRLFAGEFAFANWIADHPDANLYGFVLANDSLQPRVGATCLCVDENCAPRRDLDAGTITNSNRFDPYICLTFVENEAGWQIDPGSLISMNRMGDFGNDLGVVQETTSDVVANVTSTPSLRGAHFLTRLRTQPRARIVDAIGAGRVNVPTFIIRPDGIAWIITREGGVPQIEEMLDHATGRTDAGFPDDDGN